MVDFQYMNGNLIAIDGIDISLGQRFLVRMDCNVPITKVGAVADNFRIRKSLPTLSHILDKGGSIVAMSHIGRPRGRFVSELAMEPIRRELERLLSIGVKNAGGPNGKEPIKVAASLKAGEIALLENLRFHPGEEENSEGFAKSLADLCHVFVNDAFGTAHRVHASTVGITEFLPSVSGLLLKQEISALDSVINLESRPAVAIIGGAKLSDKLEASKWFVSNMDATLIGGGMVRPFLEAKYGDPSRNPDTEAARKMLEEFGNRIVLPDDIVATGDFDKGEPHAYDAKEFVSRDSEERVADIGNSTLNIYREWIETARLIVWNGPMGVAENPLFSKGTHGVARAVASSNASVKLAGGGSTLEVIDKLGVGNGFTILSTGGGAMLKYLVEGTLPAIDALKNCSLQPRAKEKRN